jgi:hypothetical protein
LQLVEPFLGSELGTYNETIFAARQQILIKKYTRPLWGGAFTDRRDPMEIIEAKTEERISTWSVPRGYKQDEA